MKPSDFKYLKANSLEQALDILSSEENVKIIAGGQSLVPLMNFRLGQPDILLDINDINIRLVDSTILLVFLATMRHRKTTAVASEMRLTQPAVSHALKRLRNLFDDPLFKFYKSLFKLQN